MDLHQITVSEFAKMSPKLIQNIIIKYLLPDKIISEPSNIPLFKLIKDPLYTKQKISRRVLHMTNRIIWSQLLYQTYKIHPDVLITLAIYDNKMINELHKYDEESDEYNKCILKYRNNGIELPYIKNPERLLEFGKTYRNTLYYSGEIIQEDGILRLRDPKIM